MVALGRGSGARPRRDLRYGPVDMERREVQVGAAMSFEDWWNGPGRQTSWRSQEEYKEAFEAGKNSSILELRDAGQRFGEILAGTNDMWQAFGFLMRRYRQASNKTLGDVATEFGYTHQELSDIEGGKSKPFSLEEVRKISSYLEEK